MCLRVAASPSIGQIAPNGERDLLLPQLSHGNLMARERVGVGNDTGTP